MSIQQEACRALINSLDTVAAMAVQNILDKVNAGECGIAQEDLSSVQACITAAVDVAKNRGVDQVIKATS